MTDKKKVIETLTEMADGLECAAEAENAVIAHWAHLLEKPHAERTPDEDRRLRVYLEAQNNRRRFEKEAAALRAALFVLDDGED